ncbi:MAG: helix-turn-helix transcriptional regulator [Endomicrobiia bacterium]
MVYKDFIEKISNALKEKRFTLKKVSSYAGIDISYLSKILSGSRNPPYDDTVIIKIAKILDIDEDELLFSAGKIPQKFQKNFSNKDFLNKVYNLIKHENITTKTSSIKEYKSVEKSITQKSVLSEQKISDELL